MLSGLLKIIAVASTYFILYLAELSFFNILYYANVTLAFCVIAIISTGLAVLSKSRLLIFYASIYLISAIIYALHYNESLALSVDYIFYEAKLNFSMIITFADCFIIFTGGINVFYRLYNLRRDDSSGDDIFNARLGIRQWAK